MDVFADCLAKGRLKPLEVDVEKIAKELSTARDELTRARACYVGGNWAEASTQAYFALYRSARAALNSQGYRDTNLYGLCVGLRRLFVETGKFDKEVVDHIREAKDIKDLVYESGRSSRRDARQLLEWALRFVKQAFVLLALPGFDAETIDTAIPDGDSRPDRRSESRDDEVDGNRDDDRGNARAHAPGPSEMRYRGREPDGFRPRFTR